MVIHTTISNFELDLGDLGYIDIFLDIEIDRDGNKFSFSAVDFTTFNSDISITKSFVLEVCNNEHSAVWAALRERVNDFLIDYDGYYSDLKLDVYRDGV